MIGIVLAALLWGTTGTAASLLPASVSPLATGAATMCVGGLLLALTAPKQAAAVFRGGGVSWRWIVPGALAVVAYPLAFYSSMSLAGVAVGNVVSLGTAPLFAALLERLLDPAVRRRRLDRRWAASAGAAVVGVALLAAFGHDEQPRDVDFGFVAGPGQAAAAGLQPTSTFLAGVALGLLAGLAYATYTYTAGRLLDLGHSSRGSMAAQFGAGAVVLLPVLLLTGAPIVETGSSVGVHLYLALGPMFVAYLLFGAGLRTVSSSRATTVTLLEPVVATLLAVLVVGERLAPPGWLGLALVLAGVAAVVTSRPTPPAPPMPPTPPEPDAPRRSVGSDA
ncbi:DME family drug/metabolite transporter [Frigoribacterium sp. PhB107]|uniref:DMT family transporter n=1 Tax=Frigoribacterium sp. PhB107 TaxID=2485172 RepID=UPI000F9CBE03|nr:EamA family transporter [Frigoribacterium sp. PhB107]ROP75803.1 DME family drug/metabolite transporter [Frigoribacterium sp. PhB107]